MASGSLDVLDFQIEGYYDDITVNGSVRRNERSSGRRRHPVVDLVLFGRLDGATARTCLRPFPPRCRRRAADDGVRHRYGVRRHLGRLPPSPPSHRRSVPSPERAALLDRCAPPAQHAEHAGVRTPPRPLFSLVTWAPPRRRAVDRDERAGRGSAGARERCRARRARAGLAGAPATWARWCVAAARLRRRRLAATAGRRAPLSGTVGAARARRRAQARRAPRAAGAAAGGPDRRAARPRASASRSAPRPRRRPSSPAGRARPARGSGSPASVRGRARGARSRASSCSPARAGSSMPRRVEEHLRPSGTARRRPSGLARRPWRSWGWRARARGGRAHFAVRGELPRSGAPRHRRERNWPHKAPSTPSRRSKLKLTDPRPVQELRGAAARRPVRRRHHPESARRL